jgi:hypothetical protein
MTSTLATSCQRPRWQATPPTGGRTRLAAERAHVPNRRILDGFEPLSQQLGEIVAVIPLVASRAE